MSLTRTPNRWCREIAYRAAWRQVLHLRGGRQPRRHKVAGGATPGSPSSLLKKVFEVSRSATLIQDPSARRTKDSRPSGFGFEYCASHVRFRVFQQTAIALSEELPEKQAASVSLPR